MWYKKYVLGIYINGVYKQTRCYSSLGSLKLYSKAFIDTYYSGCNNLISKVHTYLYRLDIYI